jgi:hypothetical protein
MYDYRTTMQHNFQRAHPDDKEGKWIGFVAMWISDALSAMSAKPWTDRQVIEGGLDTIFRRILSSGDFKEGDRLIEAFTEHLRKDYPVPKSSLPEDSLEYVWAEVENASNDPRWKDAIARWKRMTNEDPATFTPRTLGRLFTIHTLRGWIWANDLGHLIDSYTKRIEELGKKPSPAHPPPPLPSEAETPPVARKRFHITDFEEEKEEEEEDRQKTQPAKPPTPIQPPTPHPPAQPAGPARLLPSADEQLRTLLAEMTRQREAPPGVLKEWLEVIKRWQQIVGRTMIQIGRLPDPKRSLLVAGLAVTTSAALDSLDPVVTLDRTADMLKTTKPARPEQDPFVISQLALAEKEFKSAIEDFRAANGLAAGAAPPAKKQFKLELEEGEESGKRGGGGGETIVVKPSAGGEGEGPPPSPQLSEEEEEEGSEKKKKPSEGEKAGPPQFKVQRICGGLMGEKNLRIKLLAHAGEKKMRPITYEKSVEYFGLSVAMSLADIPTYAVGTDAKVFMLAGVDDKGDAIDKRPWHTMTTELGLFVQGAGKADKSADFQQPFAQGAKSTFELLTRNDLLVQKIRDCNDEYFGRNVPTATIDGVRVLDLPDKQQAAAALYRKAQTAKQALKVVAAKQFGDMTFDAFLRSFREIPPRTTQDEAGLVESNGDICLKMRGTDDAAGTCWLVHDSLVLATVLTLLADAITDGAGKEKEMVRTLIRAAGEHFPAEYRALGDRELDMLADACRDAPAAAATIIPALHAYGQPDPTGGRPAVPLPGSPGQQGPRRRPAKRKPRPAKRAEGEEAEEEEGEELGESEKEEQEEEEEEVRELEKAERADPGAEELVVEELDPELQAQLQEEKKARKEEDAELDYHNFINRRFPHMRVDAELYFKEVKGDVRETYLAVAEWCGIYDEKDGLMSRRFLANRGSAWKQLRERIPDLDKKSFEEQAAEFEKFIAARYKARAAYMDAIGEIQETPSDPEEKQAGIKKGRWELEWKKFDRETDEAFPHNRAAATAVLQKAFIQYLADIIRQSLVRLLVYARSPESVELKLADDADIEEIVSAIPKIFVLEKSIMTPPIAFTPWVPSELVSLIEADAKAELETIKVDPPELAKLIDDRITPEIKKIANAAIAARDTLQIAEADKARALAAMDSAHRIKDEIKALKKTLKKSEVAEHIQRQIERKKRSLPERGPVLDAYAQAVFVADATRRFMEELKKRYSEFTDTKKFQADALVDLASYVSELYDGSYMISEETPGEPLPLAKLVEKDAGRDETASALALTMAGVSFGDIPARPGSVAIVCSFRANYPRETVLAIARAFDNTKDERRKEAFLAVIKTFETCMISYTALRELTVWREIVKKLGSHLPKFAALEKSKRDRLVALGKTLSTGTLPDLTLEVGQVAKRMYAELLAYRTLEESRATFLPEEPESFVGVAAYRKATAALKIEEEAAGDWKPDPDSIAETLRKLPALFVDGYAGAEYPTSQRYREIKERIPSRAALCAVLDQATEGSALITALANDKKALILVEKKRAQREEIPTEIEPEAVRETRKREEAAERELLAASFEEIPLLDRITADCGRVLAAGPPDPAAALADAAARVTALLVGLMQMAGLTDADLRAGMKDAEKSRLFSVQAIAILGVTPKWIKEEMDKKR